MIQWKKYTLPLCLATGLIVAAVTWNLFSREVDVYQAIPRSAVAIIEVKDWGGLYTKLSGSYCGLELKKTGALLKLKEELSTLESLLKAGKTVEQGAYLDKALISVHLTSAQDFDFLFTTDCGISDKALLDALNNNKTVRSVQKRTFRNQQVYDVSLANGRQFTFAIKRGILIISFTAFLTESAVASIFSGENTGSSKDFNAVRKKLGYDGDFKLYFNFKAAETILPVFMKLEKIGLLKDISHYAGWAGYSAVLNNEAIKLTGIAFSSEEDKAGPSGKNVVAGTLPGSIPDNAAYVNISLNKLNDKADAGEENKLLASYFKNWAGETKAFITLEPLQENFNDQNIFMLEIKDKPKAQYDLQRLMKDDSPDNTVDTLMDQRIFSLQGGAGINRLFGNSFVSFANCFFVIKNDVVIFCNNKDVLKFTLDKMAKKETLGNNPDFANAIGHVSLSDVVYINPQRSNLLLQGLMSDKSQLRSFLLQFSNIISESDREGDLKGNTIILKAGGKGNPGGGLLWKTRLKTASDFTPQIVVNSNTGDKEIFTQDTAGNIYLLSKSGEILFTKNIGEKIISNVYQVDYYHNDKLQYIFNSANHVYLVDRLGNFVASYPLRLSGAATAGLTLATGNGAKPSRYFVPCSNGGVYGYESTGRPLPGWSPYPGLGLVKVPLIYYEHGKSSLMLGLNTAGKLLALDDKGVVKWRVDNLPTVKQNFSLIQKQGGFVLLNASANQLVEISAEGNDNIRHLIDSAACFTATATSDSSYLYFFSNVTEVRAYDSRNEFKNAVSLKAAIITSLEVVTTSDMKYVQIKDRASDKVILYDLALSPVAEFALQGSASFTFTDLFGSKELIGLRTDSDGSLLCYRIK